MSEVLFEEFFTGEKRSILAIGFKDGFLRVKIRDWPYLNFDVRDFKLYEYVFNLDEYQFLKSLVNGNFPKKEEVALCQNSHQNEKNHTL